MDLDGAAKEAWALMVRTDNPLPAWAALDMLLNETDGAAEWRERCAAALLAAGGNWINDGVSGILRLPYKATLAIVRDGADAARRGAWSTVLRRRTELGRRADQLSRVVPYDARHFYEAARRMTVAAPLVRELKPYLQSGAHAARSAAASV